LTQDGESIYDGAGSMRPGGSRLAALFLEVRVMAIKALKNQPAASTAWVGMKWWQQELGATRRSIERWIAQGVLPAPVRFGGSLKWRLATAQKHLREMEEKAAKEPFKFGWKQEV
jgi:hypothetical protein